MIRLFVLTAGTIAGSFGTYFLFVSLLLGRAPSIHEFNSPTKNHSLNASIAHWKQNPSNSIIMGSSVALRNISAQTISTREKRWTVIGGFGLHPFKTLQLIRKLDITESDIILPISSFELDKMTESTSPNLPYKTFNVTTLKDFSHIEIMKEKSSFEIGHLNFDEHGNAHFTQRSISNMPAKRLNETFEIDMEKFIEFCSRCDSIGLARDIKFYVVTTPFNKRVGKIQNSGDTLLKKFKFNTMHCTIEHHFFDDLPDSMFIDSHHFNKTGAEHLAKSIQLQN